jgi:chromosome segregation ATPase
MPNGLSLRQEPAQAPFAAGQPTQQAQQAPVKKLSPELETFEKNFSAIVSDINARVKLLEQRVENLRGHLEVLDSSLIEKYKAVISELRDAEDGMRSLRADIDYLKDLVERVAKRMEALASKEEVKVLERYVELWQPLQFVTRAEVKALVQSILKEQSIKIKKEATE